MAVSSSVLESAQESPLHLELEGLKQALQVKDSENSELRQQLEESKVKIASLEKCLAKTRHELESLKAEMNGSHALVLDPHHTHPDAPVEMQTASSALVENKVYFKILRTQVVYEYDSTTKHWSELPHHPLDAFTIVCVDNALVTVGGGETLYTLVDEKWEKYSAPNLPTVRYVPAVVYANHKLVVAGGIEKLENPVKKLPTVEVLNTNTNQWATVSPLRVGMHQTSAVKCGDSLYVYTSSHPHSCMQKCSWEDLLKSSPTSSVWETSTHMPACKSTLQVFNNNVLAIGGRVKNESITAIYWYREILDTWVKIGDMSIARDECRSAVLPDNTLMVVGSQSKPCVNSRTKVDTLKLKLKCTKARTNTI